jgi:hypothetical protein
MNNFIKQVIEEKFASKAQQRYFFAKANEKGSSKKEKSKWGKMAKEFSDKTKYDEIPDKVEEKEVDEIVDKNGNVARGKKPTNFNTKGITQNKTTDEVVKSASGQTSLSPSLGFGYRRYWAESDMSKSLGYDDTLGQDANYDDAKDHFEDDLGLTDDEAEERLAKMGYDEKLKNTDKVRLVENPKKFMEEYIESILSKKSKDSEIVSNEGDQMEEKEINPIVAKQLKSLKNSLKSHNLSVSDIMKHLKDDE